MSYVWRVLANFFDRQRMNICRQYLHGDILDIGCGNAKIIEILPPKSTYIGVDIEDDLIKRLSNHYYKKYRFLKLDLERERVPLELKFDRILMCAVIEHVEHPENMLNECHRLLKMEGELIITTPTQLGDKILTIITSILLTKGHVTRPHCRLYTEASLEQVLYTCGFSIERYRKFELGGNQLVVARKIEMTQI